MATRLYVGNLHFNTTTEDVKRLFMQIGTVIYAKVAEDFYTRRSRGFGFIEMASENEAENAIAQLNGSDLHGRPIRVNVATPRAERAYANGYASGKTGFGSDYGTSYYGPIHGKSMGREW